MRIYRSDIELAVTATKRKQDPSIIPPWTIPGTIKAGPLGEWSPQVPIRITGGYLNALTGVSGSSIGLAIVKNNDFERNITVGSLTMSGQQNLRKEISLVDAMSGRTIISPGERIQMVVMSGTGYKGVTIQLYAEEI